jgi:predicted metal-dependent HD superfamily phosphohydrolase
LISDFSKPSVSWPNQERWARLWQAIGARGDPLPSYERLTTAYAEPHRHYHTQQHINECLAEFDGARNLVRQPEAVEAAIWFHDAVYNPRASDNEEQSAALARRCLGGAGVSTGLLDRVAHLIMATKSHEAGPDPDSAIIIDVDLSIFGQNEDRFFQYEAQIRQEYSWVPKIIFAPKRAKILEGFLRSDRIYTTDFFHARYETRARHNLELSINKLKRRQ